MPAGSLSRMTRFAAILILLIPLTVAAPPGPHATPAAPAGVVARVPGWAWPLAGAPTVVRGFDPPSAPWLPGHRGVDLASTPGEPVLAASAGVVAFAGMVAGRGVVSVDHAGGLRTTYEPVITSVHVGDDVGLGTPLGHLDAGHPGCAAAVEACLHWGLRRGLTYLNPLLMLRPLRVRLKPLALSASIACTRRGIDVATLTIRDLDAAVKARLRLQAARNGRSMEAEARAILGAVLTEPGTQRGLGSWIREHFVDLEDATVEVPPRTDPPRAADLTA